MTEFSARGAAAAAVVAALALPAVPSHAAGGSDVCKTTIRGGLVGHEVINSSHAVHAYAADEQQKVRIDDVVVNAFGQTRYRLASDIKLLHWRAISPETYLQPFVGGTGYYVSDVELSKRFTKCVEKKLG